jgi:hypothetical protein
MNSMGSDWSLLLAFAVGLLLGGLAVFLLLRGRARRSRALRLTDAFKALSADALEQQPALPRSPAGAGAPAGGGVGRAESASRRSANWYRR